MAQRQKTPSARLQKTESKDVQAYLAQLEELLKKNTGSSTLQGQDTSSNLPFYIPGGKVEGYPVVETKQSDSGSNTATGIVKDYNQINPLSFNSLTRNRDNYGTVVNAPTNVKDILKKTDLLQTQGRKKTSEQLERDFLKGSGIYAVSSMSDGGILYNDGLIRYVDGTVRNFINSSRGTSKGSGKTSSNQFSFSRPQQQSQESTQYQPQPSARPQQSGPAQAISPLADGSILYSDGSIRRQAQAAEKLIQDDGPTRGIMSLPDGNVLYSDRQVRPMNERWEKTTKTIPGTKGDVDYDTLQTALVGDADVNMVTPYGYSERYGGFNRGFDLGVAKNTEIRALPGEWEVIKAVDGYEAVGPGSPRGMSQNSGWGNQVLLRNVDNGWVQSAEHLTSTNLKVGDRVRGGDIVGLSGNTGKVIGATGLHLSSEIFDENGQLADPRNYPGFQSEDQVIESIQHIVGELEPGISYDQYLNEIYGTQLAGTNKNSAQPQNMSIDTRLVKDVNQPQQFSQTQQFQQPEQFQQPVTQQDTERYSPVREALRPSMELAGKAINNAAKPVIAAGKSQAVQQAARSAGRAIAPTVDRIQPTGKFDIGTTEGLITPEAAQTRAQTALDIAKPSEDRGFLGKAQQSLGNFVEAAGGVIGLPETGISEIIAQGPTRKTNQAFAADLNNAAFENQQTKEAPGESLGLRDKFSSVFGSVKDKGKAASTQAGEGLKRLSSSGVSSLQNVFSPKKDAAKRAVGEISGTANNGESGQFSSLMDTASSLGKMSSNSSVADSFFKMGGSEMYKDYLAPKAKEKYGGALKLDLFNDNFYKDFGNITSVFGGSKDLGAATEKYINFEKEKYKPMSVMQYADGYDRAEIDKYNKDITEYNDSLNNYYNSIRSSANNSQSIFSPLRTSQPRANASASQYTNMSVAPKASSQPSFYQSSVRSPQMSIAPKASVSSSFSQPSTNRSAPSVSRPTTSYANMSINSPISAIKSLSKIVATPTPKVAPKSSAYVSFSPVKYSTPANANMSTNRGPVYVAPPVPQSKPKQNIFSSVSSLIKSIFR